MRITDLCCRHVRIPLKRSVKHASHERNHTDSLVVSCVLDNGITGWGEGLPREYVTGDRIEDDLELFQELDWRDAVREPIDSLADAVNALGGFSFPTDMEGHRECFGNPLRCAIELSVLDAVCQAFRVPLSEVAKTIPEAEGIVESPRRVQYSGVITSTTLNKARKYARLYRWTGFRHCKIKVGTEGIDDSEMVSTVRRSLGRSIELRADANEAWSCDELLSRVEPLQDFGLVALEQPVPHEQVTGLAGLRTQLGIPIMLDESLCSLEDGQRAIEGKYCDVFNIRLSKCGGMIDSIKLAAMAQKAGLKFQLGCQVGETGILTAAGRHFASTIVGWIAAEGSFDRFLVRERLTTRDLTFGCGGKAPVLAAPGLGVQIDPDALARVTIQELSAKFE